MVLGWLLTRRVESLALFYLISTHFPLIWSNLSPGCRTYRGGYDPEHRETPYTMAGSPKRHEK